MELYAATTTDDDQNNGNGASDYTNMGGKDATRGRQNFDEYIRDTDATEHQNSEVELYIEDGVVRVDEMNEPFDAPEWWKGNSMNFRILWKSVCDVLAICLTSLV